MLADAAWDEEDPFRDARVAAARAAAKGEEGGRQGGVSRLRLLRWRGERCGSRHFFAGDMMIF